MDEKIKLIKNKIQKEEYKKIIDTDFNFFIPPIKKENIISIEEFFNFYDSLFFDIPIEGDINSHTYLINRSNNYVGADLNNEEIDLLLQEINELRLQNIEQQDIINKLTN